MAQETRNAPPPLAGPIVSPDVAAMNLPAARPKTGAPVMAIVPTTWQEVASMAGAICRAGMAPKSYEGKADKVAVAIMHGLEIGFTPMAALTSIAVINGTPSIYGDGLLALIMGSGLLEDFEETRDVDAKGIIQSATCKMWRKGRKTPSVQTITRAMAIQAGWLKKEGPWQATPDRMFQMRARGWCGRDAFPDVLRGLRSAEEVLDMLDVTEHGSAFVNEPRPAEPKREHYEHQSSAAAPMPPAAGAGTPVEKQSAPASAGDPAPQQAEEKKPPVTDVVDQNDAPAEQQAIQPIQFQDYAKAGDWFDFADPWVQDPTRTEAELVAFGAYYHEWMKARLDPAWKSKPVHEGVVDTKKLWDAALVAAQKRAKAPPPREREPGEEG